MQFDSIDLVRSSLLPLNNSSLTADTVSYTDDYTSISVSLCLFFSPSFASSSSISHSKWRYSREMRRRWTAKWINANVITLFQSGFSHSVFLVHHECADKFSSQIIAKNLRTRSELYSSVNDVAWLVGVFCFCVMSEAQQKKKRRTYGSIDWVFIELALRSCLWHLSKWFIAELNDEWEKWSRN